MRIDYQTWIDVVRDIEEYIPKLLQACSSVSELFYETMDEEKWGIFGQLLDGLENCYKSLYMTVEDAKDHCPKLYDQLNSLVEKFPQQFIILQEELKIENFVGVGDLVKYEWSSLLADVLNVLKETVKNE
ncbi:hypothetical protein ACFSTH_19405 [Paenibacillus yanchengensis]|uniref:Uncharacterized protein n=1 Tax=Paenibacillus yanchengensis TaxID=2035833 RepID=A0ABW4YMV1_9BACL